MRRIVLCVLVGAAAPGWAHDLAIDLSGNTTAPTASNPRSGAVGLSISGSFDLSERWSLFATATYLRDLATRADKASSSGSNIFLLSGGATFLATDHWLFMASVLGSPPSAQLNAASLEFAVLPNPIDGVLRAVNSSVGASLVASYASNGLSDWEHTVDLSVGLNHFATEQKFTAAGALIGPALGERCAMVSDPRHPCAMVNGYASTLTQVRIGATYTATLKLDTDLSLDAAGFLYDSADPLSAGVLLLRQGSEVGLGMPVAPWRLTVRPSVLHRFGKFTVRLAYQLGLYTQQAGSNQLLSGKFTWKASSSLRLSVTVLGQTDWSGGAIVNRGATATLGLTVLW